MRCSAWLYPPDKHTAILIVIWKKNIGAFESKLYLIEILVIDKIAYFLRVMVIIKLIFM